MASENEPGVIKIVAERSGEQKILLQHRSDSEINAGGSPDGVLANKTIDKQMKIPKHPLKLRGGDVIRVFFKADATDGLDASDCVIKIPFWEDGTYRPLTATDIGFTSDITAPAGQWVELGTGYTIPSNVQVAEFGGGAIVVSIEDDTA